MLPVGCQLRADRIHDELRDIGIVAAQKLHGSSRRAVDPEAVKAAIFSAVVDQREDLPGLLSEIQQHLIDEWQRLEAKS